MVERSPTRCKIAVRSGMADKAVAQQWEVPGVTTSFFSVADRLISLVKASTQDDVQPATVVSDLPSPQNAI